MTPSKKSTENIQHDIVSYLFLLMGFALCIVGIIQSISWDIELQTGEQNKFFLLLFFSVGLLSTLVGLNLHLKKIRQSPTTFAVLSISILCSSVSILLAILFRYSWSYPAEYLYGVYLIGLFGLLINLVIIKREEHLVSIEQGFLDLFKKIDLGTTYVTDVTSLPKQKMMSNLEEIKNGLKQYHQRSLSEVEHLDEKNQKLTIGLFQLSDDCRVIMENDEKNKKIAEYLNSRVLEILRIEDGITLMEITIGKTVFDPEYHECKKVEYKSNEVDNTIIKVVKNGFLRESSVIRKALVIVNGKTK